MKNKLKVIFEAILSSNMVKTVESNLGPDTYSELLNDLKCHINTALKVEEMKEAKLNKPSKQLQDMYELFLHKTFLEKQKLDIEQQLERKNKDLKLSKFNQIFKEYIEESGHFEDINHKINSGAGGEITIVHIDMITSNQFKVIFNISKVAREYPSMESVIILKDDLDIYNLK